MWIIFKIKLSVGTSDIHITCIGSLSLLTFLYTFVFVPPTRAVTSEKALNACQECHTCDESERGIREMGDF